MPLLAATERLPGGSLREAVVVVDKLSAACGLADALATLFERDRQLVAELNAAQRRLLGANERLTVVMPVGAVLCALLCPADADLGLSGRPAVLDAASPAGALQEVADTIRRAMLSYQSVAERRRQLAADIGEATVRLVDALTAVGFTEAQAREADVWALRDRVHRGRLSDAAF